MESQYENIEIRKPLYDNMVYIYDAVIKRAIRHHRLLRIKIPQGIGIVSPHKWLKTGKRMEKVFLRPDQPMVLWGNYLKVEKPKTDNELLKEMCEQGIFG